MSERKLLNRGEAQEESDSRYDTDNEMSNDKHDFIECSEEKYGWDDEDGISLEWKTLILANSSIPQCTRQAELEFNENNDLSDGGSSWTTIPIINATSEGSESNSTFNEFIVRVRKRERLYLLSDIQFINPSGKPTLD
eukprot:gene1747-1947_t